MKRNIGVAIAIPPPWRDELQAWRERFGDPNAAQIVPHITLLPPSIVPDHDLPEIEEHLRGIAARERPFEMHLRGAGTFRPVSPVVFVGLASGISDCERLEVQVRSGPLGDEGRRFPYHPHVTVAHDLPDASLDSAYDAMASYDARFWVWGFSLFEQGEDRHWRPQRDFTFGAGGLPGPVEHKWTGQPQRDGGW